MRHLRLILFLFIACKSELLNAQFLRITNTLYPGFCGWALQDSRATVITKDKGLVFVGLHGGTGAGNLPNCPIGTGVHGLMCKLDSNGSVAWVKSYCHQSSYAKSICQTPDGGFATNGLYYNTAGGMSLVRYDSVGNFLWEKEYGSVAGAGTYQVTNTPDHGFALIGFTLGQDGDIPFCYVWPPVTFQPSDWVLMKLDSLGNKQWVKVFGTTGDEELASIVCVGKSYYVTGHTKSKDHECADTLGHPGITCYTMKFDSSGSLVWSKAYGSIGLPQVMFDDRDSTLIIYGYSSFDKFEMTGNHGGDDMAMMKLDTAGNLIWARQYGGATEERPNGLCKGPGNTYLLVGTSDTGFPRPPMYTDPNDGWIFYVDNTGNIIDQEKFGGNASEGIATVFPFKTSYGAFGASNSSQFWEGTGTNVVGGGMFISQLTLPKLIVTQPNILNSSLILVPNPTHLSVKVSWNGNHPNGVLICINALGQTLFRHTISREEISQDISTLDWPTGCYTLIWQPDNEKAIIEKLIVN